MVWFGAERIGSDCMGSVRGAAVRAGPADDARAGRGLVWHTSDWCAVVEAGLRGDALGKAGPGLARTLKKELSGVPDSHVGECGACHLEGDRHPCTVVASRTQAPRPGGHQRRRTFLGLQPRGLCTWSMVLSRIERCGIVVRHKDFRAA